MRQPEHGADPDADPSRQAGRTRAAPLPKTGMLVRALTLRHADGLLLSLDADPRVFFELAGIDETVLALPVGLIPYRKLIAFLEIAAKRLDRPDLGIRLALFQRDFPLSSSAVGLLMTHAPTVRDAIGLMNRYTRSYLPDCEHIVRTLPADAGDALVISFDGPADAGRRQIAEYVLMQLTLHVTSVLGASRAPCGITMARQHAGDRDHTEALFGVPIAFGSPEDVLIFPPGTLDLPIPDRNMTRYAIARDYALVNLSERPSPIGGTVRWLLSRGDTRFGDCAQIAAQLHIHPRMLQRKLREEGHSFVRIRDDCRAAAARHHLEDTDVPIAEIARTLGFATRNAFVRSCHRWFGRSPTMQRRSGSRRIT